MNKKRSGFTLVEVIVVSVIVAILAVVGIQMYIGYVNDSKLQVLENVGASAATYLNAAVNLGEAIPGDNIATSLTDNGMWTTPTGETESVFRSPAGVTVTIDGDVVVASMEDFEQTSKSYPFR